MSKLTDHEKKELLKRLVALLVFNGIDISGFFGEPLDSFSYDMIKQAIEDFER
jgi:hypothetical protein